MPKFTFYLEAGPVVTPEFVIDDLPDSLAALEFARRLLEERPRYALVEITQGETEIGRLERTPQAVLRPGSDGGPFTGSP